MDWVWYCVRSSRLWSSRMPSKLRSFFFLAPYLCCGVFYWLRYCHLMVCAPHLSFIVVVLVLIMAWTFVPRVRRSGMLGVCMLFGGVWCGGCRWDGAGKGGWVGILNGFVEGHL